MMVVIIALVALVMLQILAPSIALIIEPNQLKSFNNLKKQLSPKVSRYVPKKPRKMSLPYFSVSEILNGRTAMVGFTCGIINEVVTGRSFAEQAQVLVNAADESSLATVAIGILTLLTFRRISIRRP
jgi:hypothetical protein